MNPGGGGGRCAACRYLRRKCPPHCIFSPYFPSNNPQRFVSVHRIYGASNVAKLLQQLPIHSRGEAAESLYVEAQYRIEDPVYGCVGHIHQLQQQIDIAERQLAQTQAQIAVLKSQPLQFNTFLPQQFHNNDNDVNANLNSSNHPSSGFI